MNRTNLIVKAKTQLKAQQELDSKIDDAWSKGYIVIGNPVSVFYDGLYWLSVVVEVFYHIPYTEKELERLMR